MPRRILLLITDLEIGGTPTVVRELAFRLNNPPDVNIEVACLGRWGPVADQLRHAGIDVTALDAKGRFDLSVIARLIRHIRGRTFDTVFSFLTHANAAAAIAQKFDSRFRLFQSIQTTQPKPRWHWKLQAMIAPAAEKIIVPSESVAQAASDWSDIPREQIVVIPNAVDSEAFCSTDIQPLTGKVWVGFLGRLDPIKRVPDLVEAISTLDDRFELHIFGEGAERQRIEQLIERLGVRHRITLHGTVADPRIAFRQMDLLVLPSEAEGFGLVLIEAMAAGVPVVATDVAGIRDVVGREKTGLLVPVGEPAKIASAIRRIADEKGLRAGLVAAASDDVLRRFSWPPVLEKYRAVLNLE